MPAIVRWIADSEEALPECRVLAASLISYDATHRANTTEALDYWRVVQEIIPSCKFRLQDEITWVYSEFPAEIAILLVDNGLWTHEEWPILQKTFDQLLEKFESAPQNIPNQFGLMCLANSLSHRPLYRARLESGEVANACLAEAFNLRFLLHENFPDIFKYVPEINREHDSYPLRQRNVLAEVAWTAFKIGDQNIVDRCLETCTRLQILQDELKATVDPNFDRLGDWTVATLEKRHDDADEILEETTLKHTTETVSYLAPHFADRWLVERALAHRQDLEVESTLVKTALELLTFQVEQEKENQVGMEAKNFRAEWSLLHELLAIRTRAVLSLYDRDTPPPEWDPEELQKQLGDPEKIEAARPLLQLGTRVVGDGDPRGIIHRCPY